VLVTRPEPGASRTAARLSAAGFEAVVLPLTRIAPLDFAPPDGDFDAVIVTSAQALSAAAPNRLFKLPVFAVGEATAASARTAGFENVMAAGGSVGSAAALIGRSVKSSSRLIYLCGKVRRPELESALAGAGFKLSAVETYDAVPVIYSEKDAAARLGAAPFSAVTLMSAQAAQRFAALARAGRLQQLFKSGEIICFSKRIADELGGMSGVSVIREASEDALMELLLRRFPQN
jgi:uroporphyrinogen-III synthase